MNTAPLPRTLSRRTLAAGTAWTVPALALAAAAPAYAASPCLPAVFDWDTVGVDMTVGSIASTPAGTTMTVTSEGDFQGLTNRQVRSGPEGGITGRLLRLEQSRATPNNVVAYTLAFSAPVTNLTLTVLDVDAEPISQWIDSVYFDTGFTQVSVGERITGNGTAATPYRSRDDGNEPSTTSKCNVTVRFAGPLTSVKFYYKNLSATTSVGNQGIGLADVTFTPTAC